MPCHHYPVATDRHWRLTVLRCTVAGAVLLLVSFGHVADAPPASACSCPALEYGGDDSTHFAEAAAVFVGEVVDYSTRNSDDSFSSKALWVFRVKQVYKGNVAERQGVLSGDSQYCGLNLPKTGPTLVFASRSTGDLASTDGAHLVAGLCGGSRALGSYPLPKIFGDPEPPRPGVGGPMTLDDSQGPAWMIGVTALAAVGLMLLARSAHRRWRVGRRSPNDQPAGH